ncbi:MAG TPA: hypothetical protein PLZ57_02265 [Pseudobdellovibrionaceae bacterium]|nr:hypothetical protein [Pseudobdellovibrionaceae bacterium]
MSGIAKLWSSGFSKLDGRWLLFGSHISLLILAVPFLGLSRTPLQIFSGLLAAVVTELLWHRWAPRYAKSAWRDRVLSALAEGAGLLILLQSEREFFFVLASVIAVSSKYIFLRADRSHIFNPTNFAAVALLAFLPFDWFAVWPDEFNTSLYPVFHVVIFGIYAVRLGGTWRVTAGYFACILLSSLAVSAGQMDELIYWLGPELGVRGMIFAFLMITDPKTTPRSHLAQMLFGAGIGIVHTILKAEGILYAKFIALFAVTTALLAYEVFRNLKHNRAGSRHQPAS